MGSADSTIDLGHPMTQSLVWGFGMFLCVPSVLACLGRSCRTKPKWEPASVILCDCSGELHRSVVLRRKPLHYLPCSEMESNLLSLDNDRFPVFLNAVQGASVRESVGVFRRTTHTESTMWAELVPVDMSGLHHHMCCPYAENLEAFQIGQIACFFFLLLMVAVISHSVFRY